VMRGWLCLIGRRIRRRSVRRLVRGREGDRQRILKNVCYLGKVITYRMDIRMLGLVGRAV
jgi:hypothetical protein